MSYDKACTLLVDMRDAYAYVDRRPAFDADFAQFLGQYSRRSALVRRLEQVLLLHSGVQAILSSCQSVGFRSYVFPLSNV